MARIPTFLPLCLYDSDNSLTLFITAETFPSTRITSAFGVTSQQTMARIGVDCVTAPSVLGVDQITVGVSW